MCDSIRYQSVSELVLDDQRQSYHVMSIFSARCFRRTNHRAISMMFIRPSVCLSVRRSVWDGRTL